MADRSKIIVVDANIWIAERLFKSSVGVAFLYALKQTETVICLPDVIEAELIKGITAEGDKAVKAIQSGYLTVQTLIGSRPDYQLPTYQDFEIKAKERIAELGNLIQRTELSFDQYKAALSRVIKGIPPSKTKEQFRDSLLWEVVRHLALSHAIAFVTRDSDFYQDGRIERGPAQELVQEIKDQQLVVRFYEGLDSYLSEMKEKIPPLDYDTIAREISSTIQQSMSQYGSERQLSLGSLNEYGIEAYLTENQDVLAVSFELSYNATDQERSMEEEANSLRAVVSGSGSYNLTSNTTSDLQLSRIECRDAAGNRIPTKGTLYISVGTATIGTRMIPFSVRRKLEK
jgi:hypothetical protein